MRSIQVDGRASLLTDEAEIQRAVYVSREQFQWLKDISIYDTFKKGTAHHPAFFLNAE